MSRAQFMEQLKKLLSDISEAERQEALDYYESYFDDAGEENETEVIRELGSPGKVAAIIKADLKESNDKYAEYTELGYEDTRTKEEGQMPDKYTAVSFKGFSGKKEKSSSDGNTEKTQQGSGQNGERKFGRDRAGQSSSYTDRKKENTYRAGQQSYGPGQQAYGPGQQESSEERRKNRRERGYHAERKRNNGAVILILILLVFLSPLIKGAVGGVFGIIVTIALLPFLLVFGLGAGVFGLIIGAIACGAAGIALCFTYPAAGALTIGIGCLMMAVGIVFLVLLVWLAGKFLPKLLRKFTDLCYNILHKEKKEG